MGNLFGRNQLKELAARIPTEEIASRLALIQMWSNDFHTGSLKTDKETSREQQYNTDFFKTVLGYVEKPASPYTLEPKASTQGGQLPDLVLGLAAGTSVMTNVAAVVELKGASIDLDRPQQRSGNLTPVQQGFKYKPLYPHCPFVIVSNFYEFRLYHDNQLDFESWTLDELIDPAEDYRAFKTWYLLLCQPNFTSASGPSKTESLISEIRTKQETIGKKFYEKYSDARLELLRDLYRRNPSVRVDINLGIEKAQKLIDRVVFASFAEDRGLLPDNTVQRVIQSADAGFGSLWSNVRGFFDAVDKGSERLGIPSGYNGGLFRTDPVLDALDISDPALRPLLELSNYDFEQDLSVNVLGHIFEQSITDLETIREKVAQSNGLEIEEVSRRKKDGIFYTPDYVVRQLVDNSLGSYLREHEERFREEALLNKNINEANYAKREREAYIKYQQFLQGIRVLDPACGSGAFLVNAFDYLMAENARVGAVLEDLFSTQEYVRLILQNNIFGVDLNGESVEITQLSLWLKSAKRDEKLTSLGQNIRPGNSLISDPTSDLESAFNWPVSFPEIMADGGFDVVIGNPPYGAQVSDEQRKHLATKFQSYEYQFNSYSLFYEQGLNLLRSGGVLGYITPATFTYQHYFKKLRALLQGYEHSSITKYTYEVFEDANIGDTVSWVMRKRPCTSGTVAVALVESAAIQTPSFFQQPMSALVSAEGTYALASSGIDLVRINATAKPLGTLATLIMGIKPYQVGKGEPKQVRKTVQEKPFTTDKRINNTYRRCFVGRDFHRYKLLRRPSMFISYGKWLAEPRESAPFDAEAKIIIRQTSDSLIGYLDETQSVNLNNVYNIYPSDTTVRVEYLLAVINSPVMNLIYRGISQEEGRTFAEVKRVYLAQLPIIVPSAATQDTVVEMVGRLLKVNARLFEHSETLATVLRTEYGPDVWKGANGPWWSLDFREFSNQFRVRLSLSQKKDLLEIHGEMAGPAASLAVEASTLVTQINDIVHSIYGLTQNELMIVAAN